VDICERTSLLPGSCVCLGHPAVIGVSAAHPATDNTSLMLSTVCSSQVSDRARAKSSDRRLTCADADVERLGSGVESGPSGRQINHQVALTWVGAEY
jgi:hypothetical protein